MAGYIEVPIETDPDDLATEALTALMAAFPEGEWSPSDASLEVWYIQVLARMVAEARDVGSAVPTSIFRWYGRNLIRLDPIDAAPANVATTWTMIDAQGYTIEEGTVAAFRTAGDELVPFVVRETFSVSPGATTTLPGAVILEAVDPGAEPNGLLGTMEVVDALAFVATITAVGTSSGGVDPESDDEYLDRLNEELQLLTPRPILPVDFAVLARRTPGVYRALGIGEYDPGNGTFNNERTVTVAVVDRDGQALSTTVRESVRAYLDALREVNFVVHVASPTYTTVTVTAGVRVLPGYDPATVLDRVRAAINTALNPGVWGGGNASPPEWRVTANRVRYTEMAALIDGVEGVDYVDTASLRLNGQAGDVFLSGAAPLPTPGVPAVTAV